MPDFSNLTSGQYAYLLLRQLQRDISCDWKGDRMAAVTYFGAVFKDPTVIVDYAAYQEFSELMAEGLEYCAKNNLYALADILENSGAKSKFLSPIKTAFSNIGCTVDDSKIGIGQLKITAPSGTVYEIYGGHFHGNGTYEYLWSRLHCTDEYWDEIKDVYGMGNEPLRSISEINTHQCGESASFEVRGQTVYVSGTGKLWGSGGGRQVVFDSEHPNGSLFSVTSLTRDATTLVLGAGIDTLGRYSCDLADSMTLVCLRAENDAMTFEANWFGASGEGKEAVAKSMVIYTDNAALMAYSFSSNVTVTWHALSEWEG